MPIFWVIFSYLLGSIPFGYLIGRLSGKNVLQIGWRKTSGSNVFKNVGKWQGVLTGILDISKGYLAVYGAQKLGFPSEVQLLSGVAAVSGHNWSVFLKFSGGRGIATFIGAFLALAPQVLFFSLIPFILLAIIWNSAIGTILFLITTIFVSRHLGQFETAGIFSLASCLPIFVKRLSPLKEISAAQNKAVLIRNRLLFDNDEALLGLRIKKIFWRSTKFSWQAAKFGVKMAKKPIDKLILKNHEKIVTAISVEDFKKMMLFASKKIVLHQEEINKINVFPVADKDTGYNLAATLLGVEGVISQKDYPDFRELTKDIKEAVMINARGNAGMIYTGYLIEVLDRIKHLETIDAFHLGLALQRGIKAARTSVAEPVEGTILDVVKVAGEKTFELAKTQKEKNIIKILEEAQKFSEVALKETKEKLPVLKQNDVVDAGALGFVKILEAWIESLKGIQISSRVEITAPIVQPKAAENLKYRYEAVLSFEKPPKESLRLPTGQAENINVEKIKEELSLLGDSLDIIEVEDKVKLHIHTNQPDLIKEKFKDWPEFEWQLEDMQLEIKKTEKKPLGLVVDEIADLPREFLEKYGITEVPFTTRFPDGEIITSKEEIYSKMKEALKAGKPLPTTSAPSFKHYLSAYEKALEKFEKILVITVSSKLSGAYSSARIARSIYKKPMKLNIYVFDCFTAEVGEGLVAMKAQELISQASAKGEEESLLSSPSQGKTREEILEELKDFCPKINLIGCISDFKYVVHGGRVKLPKIFLPGISLIQKMRIQILVRLKNGRIKFFRARLGKNRAKILAREISRQRNNQKIRVAIAHAAVPAEADALKKELEALPGAEVLFVSSVSPVVGTHTGPGALLAAFYPIDT